MFASGSTSRASGGAIASTAVVTSGLASALAAAFRACSGAMIAAISSAAEGLWGRRPIVTLTMPTTPALRMPSARAMMVPRPANDASATTPARTTPMASSQADARVSPCIFG
jgi:hypothetical protein